MLSTGDKCTCTRPLSYDGLCQRYRANLEAFLVWSMCTQYWHTVLALHDPGRPQGPVIAVQGVSIKFRLAHMYGHTFHCKAHAEAAGKL